jgi:hypothetical protein
MLNSPVDLFLTVSSSWNQRLYCLRASRMGKKADAFALALMLSLVIADDLTSQHETPGAVSH